MIPTQEVIRSQDNSIRELLRAVRDQSDQLNLHRVKIKSLEEKVNWSKHRRLTVAKELTLFDLLRTNHKLKRT